MFAENTPLTFLDRDPQTGRFDLIEHDMISKGARVLQRQPASISMADGGQVVIIGAGVGGLTVAYDLLKQNEHRAADKQFRVTVLEAMGRVGGRSITLRPGDPARPTPEDSFTEEFIDHRGRRQVITQTCTFEREPGQAYEPYLNAGPGRIPSCHIQLLALCQELGVELEVYVMETRSNLVATKTEGESGLTFECRVNRQVVNDIRGYLAQDLYERLVAESPPDGESDPTRENLLQLLRYFGALSKNREGNYSYQGSQRAGFATLPGTNPGVLLEPLDKDELVNARLWERSLYQAEDFVWQQTSFQPVGGMDMIEKALARRIRELARISQPNHEPIKLDCPVSQIRKFRDQWVVTYQESGGLEHAVADFCVVNMPIPLLRGKLQERDFSPEYWASLDKVMSAKGFLRPTCKVGWQAERKLWQKPADQNSVSTYGGISRIDHPMTQMWYPSDQWHARLGVLTGAYNYEEQAERWGKMLPKDRIEEARAGAKLLHGEQFGNQLRHGISIAWQNLPYLRGGWVDWEKVAKDEDEQVRIMNTVREGEFNFYIVGDQVSALPGWKEGAVATALEVFGRVCMIQGYVLPPMAHVPDTRALIEGYLY